MVGGEIVVPFYSVGSMNAECSGCGALHFPSERVQGKSTFYDCCCHGKFPDDVVTWSEYPMELSKYFTASYDRTKKRVFLDNVRAVNNALAPGCFCAHRYKHRTGRGPPTQRIYGQTYHTINEQMESELEEDGNTPR